MRKLSTRIAKLESAGGAAGRGTLFQAAVECPFPTGDERKWAAGVLKRLCRVNYVVVVEGPEWKVLVPPMNGVPIHSDEERTLQLLGWPRFVILAADGGGFIVGREDDRSDKTLNRILREMEAEANGGVC